MSPATQSWISADEGGTQATHLVVKRGHRGRYRFALITDQGWFAGEVMVEDGSGTQPVRLDATSDKNATC